MAREAGLFIFTMSSNSVPVAVMKHHDHKQCVAKRFIWLTYPECRSIERSHGRDSNLAGTWRQELLRGVLLTGLLTLISNQTQNFQPRDGTSHNRLDTPHNNH